ncbi:hypothetical protein BXZ70DRAFT_184555 [Cristinia sonorae]|uniref:Uncharacterized protein n=1 Tax=Cristinia sonorae TaxID=1940300 RepID=A0A8K0UQ75_9AGAR|nr:hypothetical protein BXZ70DRAFT_184555 [Cristinia sonorae]
MHSTAVLVLALAACAAPALSAPTTAPVPPAADPDASGASALGVIGDVVHIGDGIISGAQGIKNLFTGHRRREFEELIARQAAADADSGALGLDTLFKVGKAVIGGISSLVSHDDGKKKGKRVFDEDILAREDLVGLLAREDVQDLLARQATDESGAINFGKILSTITSILKRDEELELAMREEDGLFARQATDQSGAINFGKILSTITSILKRDEELALAMREDNELLARQATDESGAINFGKILSTITSILKRDEELELAMREEDGLLARELYARRFGRFGGGGHGFGSMPVRSLNELD